MSKRPEDLQAALDGALDEITHLRAQLAEAENRMYCNGPILNQCARIMETREQLAEVQQEVERLTLYLGLEKEAHESKKEYAIDLEARCADLAEGQLTLERAHDLTMERLFKAEAEVERLGTQLLKDSGELNRRFDLIEELQREVERLNFTGHDHPEANGKQPSPGAFEWTFSFTLEDGRTLKVHVGEKGFRAFENMFLKNRDADYQERENLKTRCARLEKIETAIRDYFEAQEDRVLALKAHPKDIEQPRVLTRILELRRKVVAALAEHPLDKIRAEAPGDSGGEIRERLRAAERYFQSEGQ